jgi:hypothetical protein
MLAQTNEIHLLFTFSPLQRGKNKKMILLCMKTRVVIQKRFFLLKYTNLKVFAFNSLFFPEKDSVFFTKALTLSLQV